MAAPDFQKKPDIRLYGEIDDEMVLSFQEQLDEALEKHGPLILELSTNGGHAESARRMAQDITMCREIMKKEIYFLGKTFVYSAGITLMAAFPKSRRYITRDTILLIHERRLEKEVDLREKPLEACAQIVQQLTAEIKMAQVLEKENFERLAKDTNMSPNEIMKRAVNNWYVMADEALELGLVAGLVPAQRNGAVEGI